MDESYFDGRRKGKRGRGAAGKVPVFGLLKRGGKVYAKVIPDATGKTLKAIMETKIVPDSIVYSDTFNSYNVLDVSDFKHYRINHSRLFADRQTHNQRHREFLEPGQTVHAEIRRCPEGAFCAIFEGVRVAV
jgi:transposase